MGDCHEMGNLELVGQQVNNDIESQLEKLQYKLTQWGEKYSRERSKKAIEPEILGDARRNF